MAGISVPAGWTRDNTRAGRRLGSNSEKPIVLTARALRLLVAASLALLLLAVTGILPSLWSASSIQGAEMTSAGETAAVRVVTVRPGDSLWAIAKRSLPAMEVNEAMALIKSANGTAAQRLLPGQQLTIPG